MIQDLAESVRNFEITNAATLSVTASAHAFATKLNLSRDDSKVDDLKQQKKTHKASDSTSSSEEKSPEKKTSKSTKICEKFVVGKCRYGDRCRYIHDTTTRDKVSAILKNTEPSLNEYNHYCAKLLMTVFKYERPGYCYFVLDSGSQIHLCNLMELPNSVTTAYNIIGVTGESLEVNRMVPNKVFGDIMMCKDVPNILSLRLLSKHFHVTYDSDSGYSLKHRTLPLEMKSEVHDNFDTLPVPLQYLTDGAVGKVLAVKSVSEQAKHLHNVTHCSSISKLKMLQSFYPDAPKVDVNTLIHEQCDGCDTKVVKQQSDEPAIPVPTWEERNAQIDLMEYFSEQGKTWLLLICDQFGFCCGQTINSKSIPYVLTALKSIIGTLKGQYPSECNVKTLICDGESAVKALKSDIQYQFATNLIIKLPGDHAHQVERKFGDVRQKCTSTIARLAKEGIHVPLRHRKYLLEHVIMIMNVLPNESTKEPPMYKSTTKLVPYSAFTTVGFYDHVVCSGLLRTQSKNLFPSYNIKGLVVGIDLYGQPGEILVWNYNTNTIHRVALDKVKRTPCPDNVKRILKNMATKDVKMSIHTNHIPVTCTADLDISRFDSLDLMEVEHISLI
jgi:hypothetical protein